MKNDRNLTETMFLSNIQTTQIACDCDDEGYDVEMDRHAGTLVIELDDEIHLRGLQQTTGGMWIIRYNPELFNG